ncbi:MAG: hypothetical protein M3Z23_08420 [Acidobacteriota bacterium]|nr:hypothetical protein [Acidobacteriota bacterium]
MAFEARANDTGIFTIPFLLPGFRDIAVQLTQMVDRRRMVDLPISSGNPAELVLLAPGTTNATDLRARKAAFNNAPSQVRHPH